MYIPAVKSNEYFKFLLSEVYLSMTKTANSALRELNIKYSKQLQALTSDLSEQLKEVLRLNSSIQMPQDMNILFRDLTFLTSDEHVKGIDLNHRGDGIKARHIPSILRYMQQNIEKNKPKKSINYSFIWGFEEPENGVEYLSCFEMADELYSYCKDCQMLITTHSPAFYMKNECADAKCFYVYKCDNGESKYESEIPVDDISIKIGFLPLVAPYIKQEREKFLKRESQLSTELEQIKRQYEEEVGKVIILTEGKTDSKHIKFAFDRLNLDENILNRIDYYDFGNNETLGEELDNLLVKLSHISRNNIIIGIFDRDKHVRITEAGKSYTSLGNNVFRFNIPALENSERKADDKICIEHYYSNAEIESVTEHGHLYMAKDFNKFGISSDQQWIFQNFERNNSLTPISIIDGSNKHLQRSDDNAKIISKDQFADFVTSHPDSFDFSNFEKIYEVICTIISEVENARA